MPTLEELFNDKKQEGVSLNNLFENKKEIKKENNNENESVDLKSLFKKNVLEGSVIDGGSIEEKKNISDVLPEVWNDFKENLLKRTYVGAGRDLTQGTIDFTNYLAKKLPNVEENIIDVNLPEIKEPEYFGGSFARDLLSFGGGLKGLTNINKITNIPKATNKWIRSIQVVAKGGLAEQVAFSPYEKRLSNLVEEYPTMQNPITNYLKAVGTDSEDVARAKMFAEGGILGVPFEILANVTKGGDKLKFDAGIKLTAKDKLDANNIKVFSKENQETILNSKDKVKAIDDIGKKKFDDAKKIQERLGKNKTLEGESIPLDITRPALKKTVTDPVEKASLELLSEGKVERNPNLKLNEQISDLIYTGRITDEKFIKILNKNKITDKDFARFFSYNSSDAGRTLQSLSVIQRQLNKLAKSPGADKEFRKSIIVESDLIDTQMGFFRRLDNIRRGLMVTQLATAVRNFESQVTRGGLNVMQKGLDAGMQNLAKKINPNLQIKQFADPLESLKGMGNIFRQFTPSAFKQVKNETDKILSSFPREQDRLFLRFSNDVVSRGFKETIKGSPLDKMEGAVQLLNVVNKGQEFITRRAIFQSSLAERIASNKNFYNGQTLRRLIEDNKTLSIIKEDIAGAVDDALEVTFAKNFDASGNAYEQFANKFIGFVNSIPFTGSLLLPFPRFLMNSVKFHIDFSPLGLLNFLSKGERMAFKKGDTSKISRAVLGTGLFGLAYWLRSQPYAAEKWYEFNVGKRTIDTRALNPFAAYLFVADMVKRKQNGTLRDYGLKDFAGAFLGVRAGTGLYLVDKIIDAATGQNPKYKTDEEIKKFVGKFLSGFAVPLQTWTDLAGQFFPEMTVVKDISKEPIIGEFKKRIPVPNDYPSLTSPTSIEINEKGIPVPRIIKRESPGIRQFTGITFQAEKNSAEKEFDRLQISRGEIFRRTGIPELDEALKKIIAPRIAIGISKVVESPGYKNLDNKVKVVLLKRMITKIKKDASQKIKRDSDLTPYLMRYEIEKLPKDKRRFLDSLLGKEYLNTLIKNFGSK